jgi:hypothetical protein
MAEQNQKNNAALHVERPGGHCAAASRARTSSIQ